MLFVVIISFSYSCQQNKIKDVSHHMTPIVTKRIKHNVFSERCFREANWIHYVLHFDKIYIRVWGLSDTITYLDLEKQVTSYLADSYYIYEMVSGYPSERFVGNYGEGNLTDCLYLSYDNKEVCAFFDKKTTCIIVSSTNGLILI